MKCRVLFVTGARERNFSEGFEYAVELAKLMEGGVMVLLYYGERNFQEQLKRFEDESVAVAFAESGTPEVAAEVLSEYESLLKNEALNKVNTLKGLLKDDVAIDFRVKTGKFVPAVKETLEEHPFIDVVILSPSLTEKQRTRGIRIKKLLSRIPRPVVTLSRPVRA